MNEESKRCPRCKLVKPKVEWYSFVCTYCKICMREYERSRSKERTALGKSYIRQNRQKAVELYGGKCVCCGESNTLFLEIDHVNGGGTQHRKRVTPATFYRQLCKNQSADYQILCSNCNRGKWRNGGTCPHKIVNWEGI